MGSETARNTHRREYYRLLQDIFILMPVVENGQQLYTPELYTFDYEKEKAELISNEDAEIMLQYKMSRAREVDGMINQVKLGRGFLKAAA